MNKKMFLAISAIIMVGGSLLTFCAFPISASEPTTYTVKDFFNADKLSEISEYVISEQTSSYSRNGNNSDGFQSPGRSDGQDNAQTKNRELLRVDKPGVITRMWFTGDTPAVLRFYFDGSTEPFEINTTQLTSGSQSIFKFPLVGNADVSSGGYYCYLPITFGKSLRIEGDNVHYYNINYDIYPVNTKIKTIDFTEDISAIVSILENVGQDPKSFNDNIKKSERLSVPANNSSEILIHEGSSGLASLKIAIPGMEEISQYKVFEEDGRAYRNSGSNIGSSEFKVAIDPNNAGLKLTKLIDYGIANQKVKIYVDGSEVGDWLISGSDVSTRWRKFSFDIPKAFTEGKSYVTIKSEFVSSDNDANEFFYEIYSLLQGTYILSDSLDICDEASEQAHEYKIFFQSWNGKNTFKGFEELNNTQIAQLERNKEVLNNTYIQMYYDNQNIPSVDAPLSAFFGIGEFGISEHHTTLMNGLDSDNNLYSYFPAPFGKSMKIKLVNKINKSLEDITVAWELNDKLKLTETNGYFKTQYRREDTEPGVYQTVLKEESGKGRMVGLVQSISGPRDRYFLEGDEIFYLDGSKGHSGHGTGTEDVYNGGWYFNRGIFSLPLHGNQFHAIDEINDKDLTAMYRYSISDSVHFRNGINYVMEHGGANDTNATESFMAFYYHRAENAMTLTDVIDFDREGDADRHSYSAENKEEAMLYINYQAFYKKDNDVRNGFASPKKSNMIFKTNKDNKGVMLKRLFSHNNTDFAKVYVDDEYVGLWRTNFTGGLAENFNATSEDFFLIPYDYTKDKETIRVTFENVNTDIPWNDFYYEAYSFGAGEPYVPGVNDDKDKDKEVTDTGAGKINPIPLAVMCLSLIALFLWYKLSNRLKNKQN